MPTSLELGCGTGFFTLNLKLAGVIDEGHVTDLSPGMVDVAQRNARSLGFEVDGRVADAERLPYDDDTFDLVIGHAVLHHIPDLDLALREILRVLKPGGRFVFAGEPTEHGDFIARRLSRLPGGPRRTSRSCRVVGVASPAAGTRRVVRAAALEAVVDLHTFAPEATASLGAPAPRRYTSSRPNCWRRGSAGRCAPSSAPCRRRSSACAGPLRAQGLAAPHGARPRARARRPEGPVLQRRGHRAEAGTMKATRFLTWPRCAG